MTREKSMQIACCVLDEVMETFDSIDSNGDRKICFDEFANVLRGIDADLSATDLRRRFDAIDKNRDGRVNFEEFQAWLVC